MLNNINKVRRIVKAQFGLSVPSGNPYMTTNGLAIPGNSNTQYNLLGTDYATEFSNRAEQIMAPTNNLIDFNAKMGDLFSLKLQNDRNISRAQMKTNGVTAPISTSSSSKQLFQKLGGWNTAGQVTDFADSLLFGGQREYDSPVANGLSQTYDFISNNVPPQLGLVMKGAKFVGNGLSALGLKSDNNIFNGVPIVENMTSIGAKKSHNLAINKDAIEKGGGSYIGTITNANKIQSKAGKSFSVFNSGSRRHTNRTVDALNGQFVDMGHIMDQATDMASIATNMSDLNHLRYSFNQNGGYDQRYMRAAKNGAILKRVKKINFHKYGGEIVGAINLDNWQPVITEAVEQFENGGELEWTPVITLQDGGKTKYLDLAKEYYSDYDLSNINIIEDKSPRAEGNNIYVSSDEDIIHELWHVLSNNKPTELYKQFYDSLNDNRIIELGGDLDFVKRTGDPNIFYHPSEIEARIKAAKYKTKGQNYTKDFFRELRSNENKYGYNMRDLLHMYNDENLEKIFNLKTGGNLPEQSSEQEETNQKNIIPEGALHARKHHMENSDGLTQKGIPVIDNEGDQQAEIEKNEIIFTLEVTKKLEELYEKGTDEAATEAGKLLVEQILFNTDDRTNLISTLKQGGKIDGIK